MRHEVFRSKKQRYHEHIVFVHSLRSHVQRVLAPRCQIFVHITVISFSPVYLRIGQYYARFHPHFESESTEPTFGAQYEAFSRTWWRGQYSSTHRRRAALQSKRMPKTCWSRRGIYRFNQGATLYASFIRSAAEVIRVRILLMHLFFHSSTSIMIIIGSWKI